jgi:UDP-GlcNAc:undecaprenyl-phosphate/decaprenyl-phosphate GlcNAc-1-phosphate transferase
MLLLIAMSFVFSLIATLFLIRFGSHISANYGSEMPQRFHLGDVPRLGGLAFGLSTVIGWGAAIALFSLNAPNRIPMSFEVVVIWACICAPVFAAGILDDLTQRVSVKWRFAASCLSALLASCLLGLAVPNLGIGWIDVYWTALPFLGIVLAFAGIAGLPHAMNIIDGYNGLASVVAIMICAALAYVALQQNDRELAGLLACMIGATLGFLFWNYPRGLIFAGDGGAYFWGTVIAVASVTLVQRHSSVSPWFVMLLLIYPVSETLFSVYRKWTRGLAPSMADSMHFHQLIYKRLVRGVFHDDRTRQALIRNNLTSPYLWAFSSLSVGPAVLFWYSTPILIAFCLLFIVTYISAYAMIVRFKTPRWLRMRTDSKKRQEPASQAPRD